MASLARRRKTLLACDLHRKLRPVIWPRRDVFDFANCQHAIDDFPKDGVLSVQELCLRRCYKELHDDHKCCGASTRL